MIKVTCEVKTQNSKSYIKVRENNFSSAWVNLDIDGEIFVVSGKDLKTAIDNCTNVGRV